jgi:hypothetical protein
MMSFLMEIRFVTPSGYEQTATVTVNAIDYDQAYELAAARVRETNQVARILGGRMVGQAVPSDAKRPGVDNGVED